MELAGGRRSVGRKDEKAKKRAWAREGRVMAKVGRGREGRWGGRQGGREGDTFVMAVVGFCSTGGGGGEGWERDRMGMGDEGMVREDEGGAGLGGDGRGGVGGWEGGEQARAGVAL